MLWGCENDTEPNPIECNVSCNISSVSFEVGDHILISDINIIPILPTNGIEIEKVEFFLGNKKINSCPFPPFELDYEIPDMPEGEHLLQIDIHLSASGYDNTTLWIKQNIEIKKSQTTE